MSRSASRQSKLHRLIGLRRSSMLRSRRATSRRPLAVVISLALCGGALVVHPSVSEASTDPATLTLRTLAVNLAANVPTDTTQRSVMNRSIGYAMVTGWPQLIQQVGTDGIYNFWSGNDENSIRPAALVAFSSAYGLQTGIYSDSFVASTNAQYDSIGRADLHVPSRTVLQTRVVNLISSVSKAYVANGGTFSRWWGHEWQSPMWAMYAGMAAWQVWSLLPAQTQGWVKAMIASEADTVAAGNPPVGIGKWYASNDNPFTGNTRMEELTWDGSLLSLGYAMFSNASVTWHDADTRLKVTGVMTPGLLNRYGASVLNGRTIQYWATVSDGEAIGQNLNDDCIVVNHGRVHPAYAASMDSQLISVVHDGWGGRVAQAQELINTGCVYKALYTVIFAAGGGPYPGTQGTYLTPGGTQFHTDGSIYFPQGNDWGATDYAGAGEFSAMVAAFRADPGTKAAGISSQQFARALQQSQRNVDLATYLPGENTAGLRAEALVAVHTANALSSAQLVAAGRYTCPAFTVMICGF